MSQFQSSLKVDVASSRLAILLDATRRFLTKCPASIFTSDPLEESHFVTPSHSILKFLSTKKAVTREFSSAILEFEGALAPLDGEDPLVATVCLRDVFAVAPKRIGSIETLRALHSMLVAYVLARRVFGPSALTLHVSRNLIVYASWNKEGTHEIARLNTDPHFYKVGSQHGSVVLPYAAWLMTGHVPDVSVVQTRLSLDNAAGPRTPRKPYVKPSTNVVV